MSRECEKSLDSVKHQPFIFSIGQFVRKLPELFHVMEAGQLWHQSSFRIYLKMGILDEKHL